MPPNNNNKKKSTRAKAEIQATQSPAEFFASHQQIAGYDNPGKSLYTTIRELVENALDAAESIGQLPDIQVSITEYTTQQFNLIQQQQRNHQVVWKDLRETTLTTRLVDNQDKAKKTTSGKKKGAVGQKRKAAADTYKDDDDDDSSDEDYHNKSNNNNKKKDKNKKLEASLSSSLSKQQKPSSASSSRRTAEGIFCLTVSDNGCGMQHEAIPHLLGRVLSGSKHGVRQTRGKFGLGAKMALIWAKKSTGLPVAIETTHRLQADNTNNNNNNKNDDDNDDNKNVISRCILDIDIAKNQPKVLLHTKTKNTSNFQGTTLQVWIAGNWTTYRAKITQYFQQLAIITPYAVLQLQYHNATDGKRDYHLRYDRRSEQMPPLAQTVMHHPASVNNLVLQQLRDQTRCKTLLKFLCTELAGVSVNTAKRVLADVTAADTEANHPPAKPPRSGNNINDKKSEHEHPWAQADTAPGDLTDAHITRLVQILRTVQYFKAPDGAALSPLGEYNLNLGIRKVLQPTLVATARDKPGAYEGHSFLVEAAVSLGGTSSSSSNNSSSNATQNNTVLIKEEGITVCRFANRIPLLFEGGADVVTRVALQKIKWSQYKIDPKRDKIGVFVSIVSTKIPFKGTSKEYIGDDATAIQVSVKRALQACCQQLRVQLTKQQAAKDAQTRKSRLTKYIPDVGRSLFGILDAMRERHNAQAAAASSAASLDDLPRHSPAKRLRLDTNQVQSMMGRLDKKQVTEQVIVKALQDAIQEETEESEQKRKAEKASRIPLYLVPLYNMEDAKHDIKHSQGLFTFRPLAPVPRVIVTPEAPTTPMEV